MKKIFLFCLRYSAGIFERLGFFLQHPKICGFPSKHFYDGELKTHPDVGISPQSLGMWPRMTDGYYPHVFCHVEGDEQTLTVKTDAGNEQSRFNDAEVQQVVRHANPKSHHMFLLLQNISRKARDPISNGLKGKYIFLFF